MVSKDKTQVTFHSGILTIGGTVIEVSYGKDHIFFDFGTEFRPELKLANEHLSTLLEHRLVPHLEHIYDEKLGYENNAANEFDNTAVFISHCHLDHTRMINYLDPKINLYALKETKALLESLNENGTFVLPFVYENDIKTRNIIGLDNRQVVSIGDISVEVFHVDHDAYGAMGLKITTPDKVITYTGDLRLHGFNPQDTIAFCEANQYTDMLIMEGVSISFDDDKNRTEQTYRQSFESEEALVNEIVDTVNQYSNQACAFNVYPANLLRIKEIVQRVNRTVVLEASLAKLMKQVFDMDVHFYSKLTNEPQLNPKFRLDYDTIKNDREGYFWQIVEKFEDIGSGGVYIHCDASPLGSFDPAYEPFVQQFLELGVEFKQLTCSGHAVPEDLDKIIAMIKPKLLVPIHTLKPERLLNPYGERILVERGETL